MASPSDAAARLVVLARSRPATLGGGRLVAVDGPAGSGKTTLAAAVAATVDPRVCAVVRVDDLLDGWGGMRGTAGPLRSLLEPLAAGRVGTYRRYDWVAERFGDVVEVAPAPWLVVEGVGAGHPALADLVTVLVWVEVDDALRLRRGLGRDGVAMAGHWRDWMEEEAGFFAEHRTRERADLVVAGR